MPNCNVLGKEPITIMVFRLDRSVRRRFTVAAVFLTWLLLVRGAIELYDLAVPAGGTHQPLRNVGGNGAAVALTFNVTWGETVPAALLQILDEHDVQATFFVTGQWARQHRPLLRAMGDQGHDLGSYGPLPLDMTTLSDADVTALLHDGTAAVAQGAGVKPIFFRPPAGAHNEELLAAAAQMGMMTVLWDVDSEDWLQPGAEHITNTVLDNTRAGSIVLLHAADSNGQTVQALPHIIRGLRKAGLQPKPLRALLAGDLKPEEPQSAAEAESPGLTPPRD